MSEFNTILEFRNSGWIEIGICQPFFYLNLLKIIANIQL